jgi:hypothetical protein
MQSLAPPWLSALRAYFALILLGNLAWEFLHLPLYTIWTTGTRAEQAFAAVHCTGGDLLIALASLTLALVLAGQRGWVSVAALAITFGVAYTAFSEWHNVYVRRSWAYSAWMPLLPLGGYPIGLSPILQWPVVPSGALWVASRAHHRQTTPHQDDRGLSE